MEKGREGKKGKQTNRNCVLVRGRVGGSLKPAKAKCVCVCVCVCGERERERERERENCE